MLHTSYRLARHRQSRYEDMQTEGRAEGWREMLETTKSSPSISIHFHNRWNRSYEHAFHTGRAWSCKIWNLHHISHVFALYNKHMQHSNSYYCACYVYLCYVDQACPQDVFNIHLVFISSAWCLNGKASTCGFRIGARKYVHSGFHCLLLGIIFCDQWLCQFVSIL